jgi:nucleoside-diphosphate-sugar epimerase
MLIGCMGKILGVQIEIIPGQLRPGGTSRRCPDTHRIFALGYRGDDHLNEGLEKTVQWYQEYFLEKQSSNVAK